MFNLVSPRTSSHNLQLTFHKEGFFLPNILLSQIAGMMDLIGNFIIAADAWTGNIQNEMDARYVEQSSLTNLFTENKFWGWAGLLSIFVALAAIFYFQFKVWEQEDQEQEELTPKQKRMAEFLDKASNQSKNHN